MKLIFVIVFVLSLGVSQEAPVPSSEETTEDLLESFTEEISDTEYDDEPVELLPGILAVKAEEILPGLLAVPVDINLPDCSDPKYTDICKTKCHGIDCIPASLLEQNDDIVLVNDDGEPLDISNLFDLIYPEKESTNRTRRSTTEEFKKEWSIKESELPNKVEEDSEEIYLSAIDENAPMEILADINKPNCSDPKYKVFSKCRCNGIDCLLAALLGEYGNVQGDQLFWNISRFFKLI